MILNAILILAAPFYSSFASPDHIVVPANDGIATIFKSATTAESSVAGAITWSRCKKSEKAETCKADRSITLSENFFRAFFFRWVQTSPIANPAPLSRQEITEVKNYLKDKDYPNRGTLFDVVTADMRETAKKIDELREDSKSSKEQRQLAVDEYQKKSTLYETFIKAEESFLFLLRQVAEQKWNDQPAAEATIGYECLTILSNILKSSDDDRFAKIKQQLSTPTVIAKSVRDTLTVLKNMGNSTPQLVTQPNGAFCFLDRARSMTLQCRQGDKNITDLDKHLSLIDFDEPEIFNGWFKGAFIVKQNGGYKTIFTSNDFGSRTDKIYAKLNEKGLKLVGNQYSYTGNHAISDSGEVYQALLSRTFRDDKWEPTIKIDAGAKSLTFNYWSEKEDDQAFAGCWLSPAGRVRCATRDLKKTTYNWLQAGIKDAPADIQLQNANKLRMASTSHDRPPSQETMLCSASDTHIACLIGDHPVVRIAADSSRGLFAFVPNKDLKDEALFATATVCAWGKEKISCFQGLNATPVTFAGITDQKSITTVSQNLNGICAVIGDEIRCTPDQGFAATYSLQK